MTDSSRQAFGGDCDKSKMGTAIKYSVAEMEGISHSAMLPSRSQVTMWNWLLNLIGIVNSQLVQPEIEFHCQAHDFYLQVIWMLDHLACVLSYN